MIALEKEKMHPSVSGKAFQWKSSRPFVENSRGVLIHRPRYGATYNIFKKPHVAVKFWCGNVASTSGNSLTFLDEPPDGKMVCARCEASALAHGLPSSDEIAGRHVHKGRFTVVAACCGQDSEETK